MQKTTFTIGRDRAADIPVADTSVSRRHAELALIDSQRAYLTDCQSSNGTWLLRQGQAVRIQRETVHTGDQIRFGDVTIAVSDLFDVAQRVQRRGSEPAPAPAPLPQSDRLVRCVCGAVIAMGRPCPFCA
jgi:pSer/pThr/pTyr-binding forkhead associated (FHA) protein